MGREVRNEQNDVWIAATAAATGAVLLTTDAIFTHFTLRTYSGSGSIRRP